MTDLSLCRKHVLLVRGSCPVCEIERRLEAAEKRIQELERRIAELEQNTRQCG